MAFKYLSKEILAGFDKYKYNAIDTSPVSIYLTHPFWNWFVQFYPKWLAPNVLTFGGLLCLVLEFVIFTYYDNDFYANDRTHPEVPPVPGWVFFVAGQCMFWAHTLDGTDGKQARRTGTSGPLGELFDHGIDSLATLLMPTGMYHVFGRGDFALPPERVYGIFIAVMVTFVISHWEKYNTGVLFLPWCYDISQIGMTLVFFVTWWCGYEMWKFSIGTWTAGELFELLMYIGVYGMSVPMTLWNIYVSYTEGSLKQKSLWEAMRPVIPVGIQFALFLSWANCTSYHIVSRHPRLFLIANGFLFSNIATRLIVSSMSQTRCEVLNWLLLPLAAITAGVLYFNLGVLEFYLMAAYTVLVVVAHLHYAISVVQQLADHFGIYVFSVDRPPKKD